MWWEIYRSVWSILNLDDNLLTGSVPAEFLSFPVLDVLLLGDNDLSGNLSSAMINLPASLIHIGLGDNNFAETIPDLTAHPNLIAIGLGYNQLSGDLAAIIGNLPVGIEYLSLSGNGITETIPASIFGLSSLQQLFVVGNDLDGSLSLAISNLPLSIEIAYFGNQLLHRDSPLDSGRAYKSGGIKFVL